MDGDGLPGVGQVTNHLVHLPQQRVVLALVEGPHLAFAAHVGRVGRHLFFPPKRFDAFYPCSTLSHRLEYLAT